jgi:DNA-binding GntR family transcriptional regulator
MAERLSEKAYRLLKHKIVTLDLEPLTIIDDMALARDLQVGRTPIREALHRLSAEGLVIVAPRRGMFVADISITDLGKIFQVRMEMEGTCARLAARRISRQQLTEMAATVEELSRVGPDDGESLMDIDERFHELLYEAANNEFLADILNRLHAHSLRLWHLVLDRLDDVRPAIEQHREILAALEARDADLAEALVRKHISEFQQRISAVL